MSKPDSADGGDPVMWIIVVAFLVVGSVFVGGFPFHHSRRPSTQNACINNLRIIDGAKDQWAIEHKLAEGTAPDTNAVAQYIKYGRLPICPEGGVYSLNPIGTNPTCTIPLHALPK